MNTAASNTTGKANLISLIGNLSEADLQKALQGNFEVITPDAKAPAVEIFRLQDARGFPADDQNGGMVRNLGDVD